MGWAFLKMGGMMSRVFAAALFGTVLAAGVSFVSAEAIAQTYPSRPIRMVVAFPPGGGADIPARILAPVIQASIGQQIVIENRPGASATIGTNIVAKSAADGYTILCTDLGSTVYAQALFKDLPYDPVKELVIVSTIYKTNFMLVSGPGWKGGTTLRDIVQDAKANPGKTGIAMSPASQFAMELLKQRTGLDLLLILYKGSGASITDVIGGQVPLGVFGLNSATGMLKDGKVKGIAVTSGTRLPAHPDIPAFSEISPGYEVASWLGVWAPAGTPRDMLVRLNAEITRAQKTPEVIKAFNTLGVDLWPNNLEETAQIWKAELAIWPDLIRRLGITAN